MPAYEIAAALIPDFLGTTRSGLEGCLLTYHDPIHDRRLWSFGFGATQLEARDFAVNEMARQIAQGEEAPRVWTPMYG